MSEPQKQNGKEMSFRRSCCRFFLIGSMVCMILALLVYEIASRVFLNGSMGDSFLPLRNVCILVMTASCSIFILTLAIILFLRRLPKKYRVVVVIFRVLAAAVYFVLAGVLLFFLYLYMKGGLL